MTTRSIPLLDLRRDADRLDAELEVAFHRVLRSGHYILGPEVEALERDCAQYVEAKHALGVSSGTDALLLALMALGIGPGDEVICPSYTFFATAGVIARLGATPVFADIHPCCYNIDASSVAALIGPKTKAIVPVHLYGQCANLQPLLELVQGKSIAIVEDAAQAIGAAYRGRKAGSLGTFGCFSFFPSKNLGALGDAGLLVTNDDELAEKAATLRAHGGRPKYYHAVVGGNFRMDALQGAFLRVKLKHLDSWTRQRNANAALYARLFQASGMAAPGPAGLCDGRRPHPAPDSKIRLPVQCQETHVYNQFVVRLTGEGTRDRLRESLAEQGIGTEIYYPVPMHAQKCFEHLRRSGNDLMQSESAAAQTLALPIFPGLTESEIHYVVDRTLAFFR